MIAKKAAEWKPEKLEKIWRDKYIVKTDKGLKRVKIKASDNKRIGDQIKNWKIIVF